MQSKPVVFHPKQYLSGKVSKIPLKPQDTVAKMYMHILPNCVMCAIN